MDAITLSVLGVLFVATFIRSAFGFGEALVAVPLLAFLIPIKTAAPVAVLLSITVAAVIIARDWKHIYFRSAARLIFSTFFGIPFGVLLLRYVHESVVKVLLAIMIIAFSTYSLLSSRPPSLNDDRYSSVFGFTAGVLGGAFGMNGPPLVVYGALRGWSPEKFRATLQGYFLPASLAGMFGYSTLGLWTRSVTRLYLLSLPLMLLGIYLGRIANQRMNHRLFMILIHSGLILIGLLLLVAPGAH
jgi:uncharacterized membrane protein YfcA